MHQEVAADGLRLELLGQAIPYCNQDSKLSSLSSELRWHYVGANS